MTVGTTAIAAAALLTVMWGYRHFFDLGVYRGAVRYWLIDGGDLYTFHYLDSSYGFTYPPFAALVLSPLAAMSWPVAVTVAIVANVAAIILLLRWFLVPILRERQWPIWAGCALAFCVLLAFEPLRSTLRLGQINLLLLVLVCFDQRSLRGGKWAGVGIGVAAAIKLVPAVLIGYLLVTRQYRAAVVAGCTAAAVTLLTATVAPGPSHAFWTSAVWDTDRVGQLASVSNQSIRGFTERLDVSNVWWLVGVCAVVAIAFVRVRRAAAVGDHSAAFAIACIVGCLISPVTWIHHLVWLLPALFVSLGAAVAEFDSGRRRLRIATVALCYVVLSTKLSWWQWGGLPATIGTNMYVFASLVLLATTPIRATDHLHRTPLIRLDAAAVRARAGVGSGDTLDGVEDREGRRQAAEQQPQGAFGESRL